MYKPTSIWLWHESVQRAAQLTVHSSTVLDPYQMEAGQGVFQSSRDRILNNNLRSSSELGTQQRKPLSSTLSFCPRPPLSTSPRIPRPEDDSDPDLTSSSDASPDRGRRRQPENSLHDSSSDIGSHNDEHDGERFSAEERMLIEATDIQINTYEGLDKWELIKELIKNHRENQALDEAISHYNRPETAYLNAEGEAWLRDMSAVLVLGAALPTVDPRWWSLSCPPFQYWRRPSLYPCSHPRFHSMLDSHSNTVQSSLKFYSAE
jgi:hypothetical protein